MNPKNLIELIAAVKPRSAFFTTYTISIAFIEGVLLPTLRHAGCRDVGILVDANEAANSLEEVQSNAVGRKYRLAPLLAPNGGFFHPKVAYLCCPDFDVLAIGSGNLTLPGQSNQLECLDVVSSDMNPGVFRDFAIMTGDLANKISTASKQATELLRLLESLAKTAAETSTGTMASFPVEPLLIHTVNTPALQQLVEICRTQGFQATDVTVLSPFHAPDGAPILQLKSELGATALHVGLDRATLIAPFDRKRLKTGKELDFVVPQLESDQRHLHAKVFELWDATSSLAMTGSINASAQSFNSTKNVEVSLARLLPKNTLRWEKATPLKFEPKAFVPTERAPEFAFLEAVLGTDGKIVGQISGCESLPSQVKAKLLQTYSDTESDALDVQVQPSGAFSFVLPFELDNKGAVQLALFAKGLYAQCWLNIEEDLTSTDEERKEKQAIRHILSGEFAEEDVFELFQILTRATQNTVVRRGGEKTAGTKGPEMTDAERGQAFSYNRWKGSNLKPPQKGLLGIHGVDTLRAFVRWLTKVGHVEDTSSDNTAIGQGNAGHRPAFKPIEESESQHNRFDLQGSLRTILETIPVVLSQNSKLDAAAILATVSGAHALKLSLNSTWRDERAYRPLLSWLNEFSRFEYAENGRATLIQFALGASATVAGIANQYGAHSPVAILKDNLLRFNPTWIVRPPSQEELATSLSEEIFGRLPEKVRLTAIESLPDIWNATSMDERIEELVNCAKDPLYIATDEVEQAFPGCVAAIRRLLSVDAKRRYHGIIMSERQLDTSGCPHCYQAFGNGPRLELRAKHFIVCPHTNCKRPIFYFEDKKVESHVMRAIQNV